MVIIISVLLCCCSGGGVCCCCVVIDVVVVVVVREGPLTGQGAGARLAFVRQADVVDDLLHLCLHLVLRQALQTGVEPDVLLYGQPAPDQTITESVVLWPIQMYEDDYIL